MVLGARQLFKILADSVAQRRIGSTRYLSADHHLRQNSLHGVVLGSIIVILLAGCNRNQPTPTPTPIPVLGVIPTQDSLAVVATTTQLEGDDGVSVDTTPTRRPTLTPIPAKRFVRAEELFRYGDYNGARTEILPLGNAVEPDESLFGPSQLLLALSYNEEAQYAQTLAALEPLLDSPAWDSANGDGAASDDAANNLPVGDALFRAQVQILYADTLNNLARYDEALEAYNQFVERYPWSTEVVETKRGALLLRLGDASAAAEAYRAAAAVATAPSSIAFLLETVAQIEIGLGRTDRAIDAYEGILDIAQRPAYRAQIQFKAGNVASSAGDEKNAIGYWLAATNESLDSDDAHSALVQIVNRNVDFNFYQRGLINLNNEVWLPAISAFQAYLDSVSPSDKLAGDAMLGLAQAHIGIGNYSAALTVIENLLESYPECECVGQAWLERALAQAWLGNSIDARRTYRIFARSRPDDPLAPEALWQSGLFAYREGNELEAAADLLTLVDSFPDSERAPLALYLIGLGAFREDFWDQAILFFERMHEEYPETDGAASAYWAGRSYQAKAGASAASIRNDLEEQARDAWQRAVDAEPGEYYSVLAAVALAQEQPNFDNVLPDVALIDQSNIGLKGDDGSRAFAEEWLAQWLDDNKADGNSTDNNDTDDGEFDNEHPPLGELPDEVLSDPNYIQGVFFLGLNQRAETLPILERLLDDYESDPRTLYALSLAFEEIGAYRLSLIAANNLLVQSPSRSMQERPVFLQRLVFPKRFAELVEREAEKHDIDPPLFFSLIRQESLFEEGARSFAAAQGLAQIIPDTGAWVADKVGYVGYTNDLVYRPHINLWFGAYYLDWTREYLDGNTIAALVGYNAGPGNSEGWRLESGPDDPLFVEILTFGEPRLYVKKITSNYFHYLRIYP